ncbi:RNA-guided endonuclease InsQ/TnpB family protein [Microcoleus sp. OTE_8_concoct_300]|uniref:RNA-guided endonuclease InsQ/TnpB family protein n=1 Tax=Microcoleus sp. OTE_8_concoct_300 TaxID=2964710 RepID=UPI00403F46FF
MQLVEKYIIDKNHSLFKEAESLCFLSNNLFNYANYIIRQELFKTGEYLNYNAIQKQCQGTPDYTALPAQLSQQVLWRLHESGQAFFAANKEYKQHPDKFKSAPRIPKYKHKNLGRNVITYTSQALSKSALKKGLIHLSQTQILLTTQVKELSQVRIVPGIYHYRREIVYFNPVSLERSVTGTIAGIDIGLNNYATLTENQPGFKPLIINGKPLKSINVYYHKNTASRQFKLQPEIKTSHRLRRLTYKRNCKIDNYLHSASRSIINHRAANSIETLVIGKNDCGQTGINLGKKTNQNMVSIPHAKFIEMLTYKAQSVGINVVVVTEEYTSKCSFRDNEPLYKQDSYQSRGIKRGLFRNRNGTLINADVNGSLNIVRKAFPNAFVEGIQGVVVPPVRITPYKTAC